MKGRGKIIRIIRDSLQIYDCDLNYGFNVPGVRFLNTEEESSIYFRTRVKNNSNKFASLTQRYKLAVSGCKKPLTFW
jgi:DNA-directed RNA polymerase subunit H (RpoH/RPB5)